MVQQPVITIITPVFNGAKYIRNCIDNFLAQDCAQAEHLIMDGASKDGTVEILEEYASKHPNIRFISEKDSGQSNAMNKGIEAAKGKIISFLNVDDTYEPGVFSRVLDVFSSLPEPSFVSANLNIWNTDGSFKHLNKPEHCSAIQIISNLYEWPYNPTAYFYHKNLHDKIGSYNEKEHFAMDYDFIIRAAMYIPFIHINETWGNFFLVETSKTVSELEKGPQQVHLRSEALRKKYYQQLSLKDQIKVNWLRKKWAFDLHFNRLIKRLHLR